MLAGKHVDRSWHQADPIADVIVSHSESSPGFTLEVVPHSFLHKYLEQLTSSIMEDIEAREENGTTL